MATELNPKNGVARRTVLKASAGTAGVIALSGSATAIATQGDEDDEQPEDVGEFRIPQLNLNTLEAEFEDATLQATPYGEWRQESTTYVGEVTGYSGLFVGVSLLDDDAEQSTEGEQPEIVAYLCDGEVGSTVEVGVYFWDEYDENGVTLSAESDESNENDEVKVAMVDGEFLGAVTLADEESHPFLATEATGDADLYWAAINPDEGTFIQWVVLPDGRQRGARTFDDLAGWTVE